IHADLEGPRSLFSESLLTFEHELLTTGRAGQDAVRRVHAAYVEAVRWLRDMADTEPHEDHVDTFFIDQVIRGLADDLELTARALDAALIA
ncbi:hypothetical protein, partial [Staphylococcus aureus]